MVCHLIEQASLICLQFDILMYGTWGGEGMKKELATHAKYIETGKENNAFFELIC